MVNPSINTHESYKYPVNIIDKKRYLSVKIDHLPGYVADFSFESFVIEDEWTTALYT